MNKTPPRPSMDVLGIFDWAPSAGGALAAGHGPLPYRADLLTRTEGVALHLVPPATRRGHIKIRDVIEHRTGIAADLFLRSAPRARHADVFLAFLERQLVALSWARRAGIAPYSSRPAMGISCWWAEELASGTGDSHRVRRTVNGLDRLVVFSENQAHIFAEAGVRDGVVRPVLFGADHEYFCPVEVEPRYDVLAVGVDRGRDWQTLIEAARLVPERRFDIFTGPGRIRSAQIPENVVVHLPTDFEAYRDALRAARLVVVPTFDLAYPTGQSVLLEAMASGRCVVATRTAAMEAYLRDGDWNLSVSPGDALGLASVVAEALSDDGGRESIGRSARRAVEESFTFHRMWNELAEELRGLVG